LLPDALAAYDRFFLNAEKSDPKCWAKEALAKTLVKLEHHQKDAYLRGLRHHQMEAAWDGPSETAGALRATCAHALVNCPCIPDADLLALLLEPLTDTDKSVRIEAARAIARVGGASAALLLRLRALLGPTPADKDDPEVLGAVYSALLAVEGTPAIPLIADLLNNGDDLSAEAAFALADTRAPEALAALVARLEQPRSPHTRSVDRGIARDDAWYPSVLLGAIAITRLPAAFDYLIAFIARDARQAPEAIEAIARIAPNAELRARLAQAIDRAGSPRLRQALRQHLPPSLPDS
jgi:HEAT repeat protein